MATWISRLDEPGEGLRLAVKDAIDVVGVHTTMGCPAVADHAEPAATDAACVATARAGGARIVGKTNLHELCYGVTGINPWFGTPVNPVDPERIPGGSSSGSAVAVAAGEADVGFGTDTCGSIRIPAACCGIAGLKTTWGRLSLAGVGPLARSLDTVGPLARDLAGIVAGMRLLEPGFDPGEAVTTVGRVRRLHVDPDLEAAVDRALQEAGWTVVDLDLTGWDRAVAAFEAILTAEAWSIDQHLLAAHPDRVSELVTDRLRTGAAVDADRLTAARIDRLHWQQELAEVFARVPLLALPTLPLPPPTVDAARGQRPPLNRLTGVFNLAGVPALALPIPGAASLQLVGPHRGEELLCATGAVVEAAVS
ncbi:amidase [soil metagenome]